jgi:DNA-binding NarL/FixJ family response regulator
MIMVVTFQQEFRDKICSFLKERGYAVCVPPHRQDVIPWMQEHKPIVVLLDMYVAEPNGLEVLKELRAKNYSGKVVVLAGLSVSALMSHALKLGVDQVIGGFQGSGGFLHLAQVEAAIKIALHADIAKTAFELYEARGKRYGKDLEDWFDAERKILNLKVPLTSSAPTDTKTEPESAPKKRTKTPKKST